MCTEFFNTLQSAVGSFKKGNEPHPFLMPIEFAECRCGVLRARSPSGKVWVEILGVEKKTESEA